MNTLDYMKIAADWTMDIAAENGVKIRRGDFNFHTDNIYIPGRVIDVSPIGAKDAPTGIKVILFFAADRYGKKLKEKKDGFLNYVFARVTDYGVLLMFSNRELEIHDAGTVDANTEKIETVIRKVQKLLELADPSKNPSEQEALSASMMAQRLLAKYNIDIAQVTGKEKEEEIQQVVADIGSGNKWKYSLAEVVARSYCCKCFYHGSEQVVFYGYQSDVLIARRVFVYLFTVGNSLARRYTKKERELYGSADGVYNSFCIGFVQGVKNELDKNCTALMLVVPEKVKNSFDDFTADFKKVDHSIKLKDADAYDEGFVEGQRALRGQYIEGEKTPGE